MARAPQPLPSRLWSSNSLAVGAQHLVKCKREPQRSAAEEAAVLRAELEARDVGGLQIYAPMRPVVSR